MNILTTINEPRYLFIEDPPQGMTQYFNKVPQYMLLPTFRGIPRPEVFLDEFVSAKTGKTLHYCAMGLWKEVMDFARSKGLCPQRPDSQFIYSEFNLSVEELQKRIDSWGLNISPREYQVQAAWKILKYRRSLSLLATRAGKTLIGYIVFRAAMECLGVKKILMIVPSIQLVKQGMEDFSEYKEFFNGEEIWAKGEHVETANLTIGTFQSLVLKADPKSKKYNPDFFKDYDLVCVDEAHKLNASSIQTILNQDFMKSIKLQFGFTGTLPKPGTIEWFGCQAMMGPKIQEITTMELVEAGYLVQPYIKQYHIKYDAGSYQDTAIKCGEYLIGNYVLKDKKKQPLPKELRGHGLMYEKALTGAHEAVRDRLEPHEWCMEIENWLKMSSDLLDWEQLIAQHSKPKVELMDKILASTNKNMIVFAHNTDYIGFLVSHLKEKFPNRHIYKISGSDNLKKRQKILAELLKSDDNILVGSLSCISTGITFKRISGCIFMQSMASDIINNQSLGRLLLPENEKDVAMVYDIIDEFHTKRLHNQGLAKVREYKAQRFKYEIINIKTKYENQDS